MSQGLDRRELLGRAAHGAGTVALGSDSLLAAAERLLVRPAAVSPRALRALRSALRGPVLLPSTPGYGRARLAYNTRYDAARPDAVAQPLDTRDVQAIVRWSARHGVRLVPRSGGHSYGGYSTTSEGVVVDLSRLRGIRASAGSKQAVIGPGAQLIDVYSALSRRGITIPAGSCPSVGIGGLALGGGHGLAGRQLGLTSDNLRALTIVTADGRVRQADRNAQEDLFWACRGGGGGNFGIVTSLTFRTHRARGGSWFRVTWPWSSASEAVAAWQAFAPHAPDALTSVCVLGTGGNGRPTVSASGQLFGSPSALRRLLRPLLRVGGAQLSVGGASYMALMLRWAGCLGESLPSCHTEGTRPGGTFSRAAFLAKSDYVDKPLPGRARAAMVNSIERHSRTPSLGSGALLLDAYGGAVNRVKPDATAFVHRDQLFSIQYLAYYDGAAAGRASKGWIGAAHRALRPYTSGQAYQNYIDPALAGWQRAYYGSNLGRLREVKKSYDPDFSFRFRQAIPPAA